MHICPIIPFDGTREGEDYIVSCSACDGGNWRIPMYALVNINKFRENEPLQMQCLSTYCIKVWQIGQGIIVKLAKFSHC